MKKNTWKKYNKIQIKANMHHKIEWVKENVCEGVQNKKKEMEIIF